jgi:hypothetical protein
VRRLPVYLLAPAIDVPVVYLSLRAPSWEGAVGSHNACAGEAMSGFMTWIDSCPDSFVFAFIVVAVLLLCQMWQQRRRT